MSDGLTEMERAASDEGKSRKHFAAWEPVTTAPKDGRKFDAWCVHPDGIGKGVRFSDVMMRADNSGFGVLIHGPNGVSWEYLEKPDGIYPEWEITHWMPLPAAPGEIA